MLLLQPITQFFFHIIYFLRVCRRRMSLGYSVYRILIFNFVHKLSSVLKNANFYRPLKLILKENVKNY